MKHIPLTQGKMALVDDQDYQFLSQWKWTYSHGYAIRTERYGPRKEGKYRRIYMHRLLTGAQDQFVVDHVDGDKLNNQRANLKVCTQRDNAINTYKHREGLAGCQFIKSSGKWRARIKRGDTIKHLGCFDTRQQAADAYSLAAQGCDSDPNNESSG